LAKEPKPSFIYVFRVRGEEYVDSVLIRLGGDNLVTVLKRLRAETSRANTRINRRKITFDLTRCGEVLAPTGAALMKAIQRHCGADMDECLRQKAAELKSLGYERGALKMRMTLSAPNYNAFVDGFLGLGNIEAEDINVTETRFGIPLPVERNERGLLKIEPHPSDTCIVRVRHPEMERPATYKGPIYLPGIPNIAREHFKALVRCPLFDLALRLKGFDLKLNVEHIDELKQMADDWANFARLCFAAEKGGATIEISPKKLKAPLRFEIPPRADGSPARFKRLNAICEALRRLLDRAGAADIKLKLVTALAAGDEILFLDGEVDPGRRMTFTPAEASLSYLIDGMEFLYCSYLELDDTTLAFWATMKVVREVNGEDCTWYTDTFVLRDIVELPAFPAGYDEFMTRASKDSGIENPVMFKHPEPQSDATTRAIPLGDAE